MSKYRQSINVILQEIQGYKILDLGCVQHTAQKETTEDWLHGKIVANNKDKYVVGVDIEKNEVSILKSKGYNVVYGDVENLDLNLEYKEFDTIVAGELIEHLNNPGLFLKNCEKHLIQNGKLILSTPNPFCFMRFCAWIILGKVPSHWQHTAWYSVDMLRELGQRYGLILQKFIFVEDHFGEVKHKWFPLYYKFLRIIIKLISFKRDYLSTGIVVVFKKSN